MSGACQACGAELEGHVVCAGCGLRQPRRPHAATLVPCPVEACASEVGVGCWIDGRRMGGVHHERAAAANAIRGEDGTRP